MTASIRAILSHGLIVPPSSADPDTVITAAGGNYVEPEVSDLRLGTVAGAGSYEVTGTLIPQAGPANLSDLDDIALAQKQAADAFYNNEWGTSDGADAIVERSATQIPVRILKPIDYSQNEITAGNGVISRGDLKIRVRVNDSLTSMSTADVIIYRSARYRVVNVTHGLIGGALYEFTCQARR